MLKRTTFHQTTLEEYKSDKLCDVVYAAGVIADYKILRTAMAHQAFISGARKNIKDDGLLLLFGCEPINTLRAQNSRFKVEEFPETSTTGVAVLRATSNNTAQFFIASPEWEFESLLNSPLEDTCVENAAWQLKSSKSGAIEIKFRHNERWIGISDEGNSADHLGGVYTNANTGDLIIHSPYGAPLVELILKPDGAALCRLTNQCREILTNTGGYSAELWQSWKRGSLLDSILWSLVMKPDQRSFKLQNYMVSTTVEIAEAGF